MAKKREVILFGYGSFGQHLYKYLRASGHHVKVISRLEENTLLGESHKIDIRRINFKKNDEILNLGIDPRKHLLYCAMNKTAQNLFLVLTLRTLYPDAQIIAISNSAENARKLRYAGADNVIDLYESTARRITHNLIKPAVTKAIDEIVYHRSDIKMAELMIPPGSYLDGKHLSEIDLKSIGLIIIAIIDREMGSEVLVTDRRIDHRLDEGDILVIIGREEDIEKFKVYITRGETPAPHRRSANA